MGAERPNPIPLWSNDQLERFNSLVEKRPDVARRVFLARKVISSSSQHPPFKVLRHWKLLEKLDFLPKSAK